MALRRSLFPVVLAFVPFFTSSALSAQTQPGAMVAGVVVDQTGGVLVGAQVELVNASGTVQSGSTDQSGSFQFEHVRPGAYDVRATLHGCERAKTAARHAPARSRETGNHRQQLRRAGEHRRSQ